METGHYDQPGNPNKQCLEHSGLSVNIKLTNSLLATLLTVNLSLAAYLVMNVQSLKVALSDQNGRIMQTEKDIKNLTIVMQ